MKKISFLAKLRSIIMAHKIWSSIVVIIIILGGYLWYRSASNASVVPQYVLSRVRNGSIIQTVTGTGQVSASNQLDITAQASGAITGINVNVGDHVVKGQLLATIDSTNALNTLESARIAYAKLVQVPTQTELDSANSSISQSYGNAYNTIVTSFSDLQNIVQGMKSMFYDSGTFLSDQKSVNIIQSGRDLRNQAGLSFDKAYNQYTTVLQEYNTLTRSSATSTVQNVLNDTYNVSQIMANAVQNTSNTITFIVKTQPEYMSASASGAQASATSWSSSINSIIANLLSAKNSIVSSNNTFTDLMTGANTLDIQSQQLSLKQAEQTYANYFVRAPFDGVVGRIPVSVYGQAGSGTTIATLVGDAKISTISLNEVDAAKVKTGNPVTITFDAIDGLNATGTVSEADLVGTVSQGVVTYNIKISINTVDSRIRPGMSVNATIITSEIDNVLTIPSTAVKTSGNMKYVQIFDTLPGTTTPATASTFARNSSTTGNSSAASSTFRNFASGAGAMAGANRTVTVTTATTPKNQTVTLGQADDTNIQVQSGLKAGQWVVTKTITTGASATTAAPSLLSSLGAGNRGATGGATRAATTGR